MLTQLRAATRAVHEQLDSTLPIGRPQATLHDYVCHAQAIAAWLAALQPHLQPLQRQHGCLAQGLEARLQALCADLQEAGIAGLPLPCRETEQQLQQALLAHPMQADALRWGAAYVAEGSQLGGQVLYRRLAARLAPHRLRYLQGPGAAGTAGRWRDFVAQLRGYVVPSAIPAACSGALAAFAGLQQGLAAPSRPQ